MDNILEISNCLHVVELRKLVSMVELIPYTFRLTPSIATAVVPNEFMHDSCVFIHRFYNATTSDGTFVKDLEPYDKNSYSLDIMDLMQKKLEKILNKKIRIVRLSLNLQPPNNAFNENMYCPPHVDRIDKHYTAILYLNTCDGGTVVFNERCVEHEFNTTQKMKDTVKNKKFTVKKKFSSIKNNMIIFDGLVFHSSIPSTQEMRMVININFIYDEDKMNLE